MSTEDGPLWAECTLRVALGDLTEWSDIGVDSRDPEAVREWVARSLAVHLAHGLTVTVTAVAEFDPAEFQLLTGVDRWGRPVMTAVCKESHPDPMKRRRFPNLFTEQPVVAEVCDDERPATLADLITACRAHWEEKHRDE